MGKCAHRVRRLSDSGNTQIGKEIVSYEDWSCMGCGHIYRRITGRRPA